MNIAVVGHIETGSFFKLPQIPQPGEIVGATDSWTEAGGGAAVAAHVLATLNGSCTLFTALGKDYWGDFSARQLRRLGIELHVGMSLNKPTNQLSVQIGPKKERTIIVSGNLAPSGLDDSLPWDDLAKADACYFVRGDIYAARHARKAKKLISTARVLPTLQAAGIKVDALLMSQHDQAENYQPGDLEPEPGIVIATDGINGSQVLGGKHYPIEPVPADKLADTYGCGDSFAAGITYALGQKMSLDDAIKLASQAAAEAARRRGAHGKAAKASFVYN